MGLHIPAWVAWGVVALAAALPLTALLAGLSAGGDVLAQIAARRRQLVALLGAQLAGGALLLLPGPLPPTLLALGLLALAPPATTAATVTALAGGDQPLATVLRTVSWAGLALLLALGAGGGLPEHPYGTGDLLPWATPMVAAPLAIGWAAVAAAPEGARRVAGWMQWPAAILAAMVLVVSAFDLTASGDAGVALTTMAAAAAAMLLLGTIAALIGGGGAPAALASVPALLMRDPVPPLLLAMMIGRWDIAVSIAWMLALWWVAAIALLVLRLRRRRL